MTKTNLDTVKPKAVIAVNINTSCEVLEFEYGIDDEVFYRITGDKVRKAVVHYLQNGDVSFRTPFGTLRLSDAIRID